MTIPGEELHTLDQFLFPSSDMIRTRCQIQSVQLLVITTHSFHDVVHFNLPVNPRQGQYLGEYVLPNNNDELRNTYRL